MVYFVAGWVLLWYDMYHILSQVDAGCYFHEPIAALSFALIIAGVLFGWKPVQMIFTFTPLRFIGIISYSIYLWHLPLVHLFNTYPSILALPVAQRFPHVLALVLPAVILLAAFIYLTVEKPFMLLARNKPRPARAAPAPLPAVDIADRETAVIGAMRSVSLPVGRAAALAVQPRRDVSEVETAVMGAVHPPTAQAPPPEFDVAEANTAILRSMRPPGS